MATLTEHLVASAHDELREATQHPFLAAAATSSLDLHALKTWLGQDRLYAYSYICFMSEFISKISLPTTKTLSDSIYGKWSETLIDCLVNIKREIHLFEDVAQGEGWLEEICSARPDPSTQAYQGLFADATASSRPLLTAMVTLWATEHCYYTAWCYAAARVPKDVGEEKLDVMQKTLIPNWSSPEFKEFVDVLAQLLNSYAAMFSKDSPEWQEAERAYKAILHAEKNFWPDVDS